MFKNTASQQVIVFAFDSTTNLPKTGDAANITAYISKDFGAVTQLTDTTATEESSTLAAGYYRFDITQTETNADVIRVSAKSTTSNVVVVGAPATIFTLPANFGATSIDSNGRVDVIKVAGTTQTARDLGNALPAAAAGASGGLHINGSNSGTTTYAALTVTGSLTISDGLLVSRSTSNASAATFTGNGTGSGLVATSGAGATGDGIQATAASTNGNGLKLTKTGTGNDLSATSTTLTLAKTTNITGFNDIAATSIVSAGAITTSSGAVSSVTTVTGNVNGNVGGSVASVTARVTANTDQLAGQTVTAAAGITFPTSVASPTNITAASGVALTSAYDAAKTAAQAGDVMKVSTGTGANQLDVTSGVIKANLAQILGTALTETAGQIAAAFKKFFDIASPTSTMNVITTVSTATALTTNNDKTGYALTAAYDPAKTAAQPGNAMALVADALDATAVAASGATEIANAVATVAGTTPFPANVKKINDVTLTGTGVLGDEWRPV